MLESVNVGVPREIPGPGGPVLTAIGKAPVAGRVHARGVNLAGDDQADRSVHGGVDKAVYAYALEDTEWWEGELGRALGPGAFGENLSTRGVDVTGALIGERWRIGSVLLEVSEPRFPCYKLGVKMGDPLFVKHFAKAVRPGAYLRIVEEGDLGAGDAVEVVARPDHDVSVGLFARAYLVDRSELGRVLAAPALAERWREWIRERLPEDP